MLTLLILRHAKSSWDDPAIKDHDRPLNKRGKRDASAVGKFMRQEKLTPDFIISSTAKRAMMTLQKVIQKCCYMGNSHYSTRFYPGITADYIKELRRIPSRNKRILIVGHNPGLEEFLTRLTKTHEHLHAGTLAKLHLPIKTWKELNTRTKANLIRLWHPQN